MISPTFVVPLILSFLMLSSFVTPYIHRSILISATSNLSSCASFNAHVPAPYTSAGLTTVLYTFHLMFTFILMSHNTPDTLFQLFHPLCTLWVTSASSSPFSAKVDTNYEMLMLMYKHKTGMLPHIYNALFIPSITLYTHNTRQYTEYEIEFCQTSTRQNTIAYVGPNRWTNVVVRHNPHNCLSIRVFKKEIFSVISDILS